MTTMNLMSHETTAQGWGAPQFQPSPERAAWVAEVEKEELISELLTPEPWPMTPEEVEKRRVKVQELWGHPFPRRPRGATGDDDLMDMDAVQDWRLLDALSYGVTPDVEYLFQP